MNHTDPSEAVERKQTLAGVFHRASFTYDRVGPNFFSYFGSKLVEHAALPRGARVLDVATGRGAILFPAAQAVGPDGSVTGIDLAEGMVEETNREIRQRGLSNIKVHQMDAEHLDFPDASFDIVLSGFAIFFFPQVERALAEFRRVLAPGGRIAITTWEGQRDKRWEWFYELVESYLPSSPQKQELPAQPDFGTPQGMEKLFQAAGFDDIRIISEALDFVYATKEEWWASLWSHGSRASLERVEKTCGAEKLAQLKAECFARMDAVQTSEEFPRTFSVLYTLATKPA